MYCLVILGDVKEAINQVRQFVQSESAFFVTFLEEGLRFSSFMFLYLIWIHVLRHAFDNPQDAAKHLKSHPFFKEFVARSSTETYIEGLCNSMKSLCIGLPVKWPSLKRGLTDMLSDSSTTKIHLLFLLHQKFNVIVSLKMMIFL